MPVLRFSRDKRGYENFYLVQPSSRRGKSRSSLLYWFHTPPNVKVGRHPFDDEARRAIEAQNPNLEFEWDKLLDMPIPPPPEPERWRERRRAQRSARQAAVARVVEPAEADAAAEEPQGSVDADLTGSLADDEGGPAEVEAQLGPTPGPGGVQTDSEGSSSQSQHPRRRRRRRGGRRNKRPGGEAAAGAVPQVSESGKSAGEAEPASPANAPDPGEPGGEA